MTKRPPVGRAQFLTNSCCGSCCCSRPFADTATAPAPPGAGPGGSSVGFSAAALPRAAAAATKALIWRTSSATDAAIASEAPDPMPPTPLLTYVTFRMTGTRGGGYEPEIVLSDFRRVERAILAWAPDILLVADPDLFMVDTHRLPGFNSLMRAGRRPTTIASFTTFMAEAVMKMPEYWWVHVLGLKPMLETGIAVSYGAFDHVFVNGQHTLAYLAQLRVPLHNGGSRRLDAHAQVVASRVV